MNKSAFRARSPLTIHQSLITIHALLASAGMLFGQGSLTPPGAPAETMKTLQQVEPRIDLKVLYDQNHDGVGDNTSYEIVITEPGSYYLSSNMGPTPSPAPMPVTRTNGIQINAEGVTLDLNGFQISRSSGGGGNGIEIPVTSHRASIRNASIKGFAYGIRSVFATNYPRSCAFRDIAVSGCTVAGILAGDGAVLESCRAHDNSGTYGIFAATGSSLTNCLVSANTTTYGIYGGAGGSLTNCSAYSNTGTYGIYANVGSSLTNCSASNNTATYGINANVGCSLTNCSAYANQSAAATSAGIGTGIGVTVTHCSASSNTSTAAATPTTGMGFDVGVGSTIQNCTATFNRGDGMNISSDSVVRDNLCRINGNLGDGAGIHATSDDNRIDGNNVTDNDRGIDVDAGGNLIIKNSASGNGTPATDNYALTGTNTTGAIITATGTISADPWANFSY